MDNFAIKIKELRKLRAETQKHVSQAIGISERQFIDLENGKKVPTVDTLIKLADYYNVSLDYLVGRDEAGSHKLK